MLLCIFVGHHTEQTIETHTLDSETCAEATKTFHAADITQNSMVEEINWAKRIRPLLSASMLRIEETRARTRECGRCRKLGKSQHTHTHSQTHPAKIVRQILVDVSIRRLDVQVGNFPLSQRHRDDDDEEEDGQKKKSNKINRWSDSGKVRCLHYRISMEYCQEEN